MINIRNMKNTNNKLKKFIAAAIAVFILISNFAFLNISASAGGSSLTMSVNMTDSVQASGTFEARVTLTNNTSQKLSNIVVSAENTGGVISITTLKDMSIEIEANATRTVSYQFSVSSSANIDMFYDITFTVSRGNNIDAQETRRIRVGAVPQETPAVPMNPYFEKVSEIHPSKVTIGDNLRLAFSFRAMNGQSNNVNVKITSPEGAEAYSATEISVGTMFPTQSYVCYFDFTITNKAKAGMQKFEITVSGSSGNLVYPISIMFVKNENQTSAANPNIIVVSTEIPENIKQGEIFEIKAVLENNGTSDIKPENKMKAAIVYPTGITELSSKTIPVDSLKQNEQTEVSFKAIAGDSIEAKYYSFLLNIDYNILDENDTLQPIDTKTQYVGLNVLASDTADKTKNFSIEANIAQNVKSGEDFKVSVTVTNNGGQTEKNLFVKVTPQTAGVENRSINNISIPELKSGEKITNEVTFNASEAAAGKYCLFEISLTGTDINAISQYSGTMVSAIAQPKIIIESIKLPQTINIGDTFNAEITVANTGAADAENIIVTFNRPDGILNTTSNIITIDSIKSGAKQTGTISFIVTQDAGYGYKQFSVDVSAAGIEKINQYFGVTVNSPHLIISSVKIPSSIGVNTDFNAEVAVKNTGADTSDVILTLAPQGGLINKSSNNVKIDNIKSGETVVKTFTFMASETAPDGYVAIGITLSNGQEQSTQFSGIIVNNPPKTDEEQPDNKSDIPVVIISRFSYTNVDDGETAPETNSGMNTQADGSTGMNTDQGVVYNKEDIIREKEAAKFSNTSATVAVAPAPAVVAGDYYNNGTMGNNSGLPGGEPNSNVTPINPVVKDSNAVYGGKTFIFTIELLNTHKTIAVKDLKITFLSRAEASKPGGIFNPKSGSNTFFVERLGPGQSMEQSIELLVKSDVDPDSYGITISLSYKNENGIPATDEEIINIPVQQEMRFSIGDLPPIPDVQMGDDAYVNVQFGNLGKSLIYNAIVRVQGDGFMNQEGTYYAGNIEAGKFLAKEFALTPNTAGFLNGSFIFTYEDADGNTYEEQQPFSFNVMGGTDPNQGMMDPNMGITGGDAVIGPDGLPVMNPEDGTTTDSGGFWLFTNMNLLKWAIIVGSGLVIIGAAVTIIVVVRRRIKNKNAGDDDDDL